VLLAIFRAPDAGGDRDPRGARVDTERSQDAGVSPQLWAGVA